MAFVIHDFLRESAERSGEKLAVIGPKASLTYRELESQSDALARCLIAQGIQLGDAVGIAMHKCCDAIVGVYGILKAGACYVPIDPFAPAIRSSAIVANMAMTHVVTTNDRATGYLCEVQRVNPKSTLRCAVVPNPCEPQGEIGQVCWNTPCSLSVLPAATDTHLAYVLHTSGSTGEPKGVAISHRNALAFIDVATDYWQVNDRDRLCSQAPLHFDLSVFDLFVAAKASATVVLIPEFYAGFPKKMASAIDVHGITIWNSVVSTLTLMMERGKPETVSFESLRAVIFSGEVMPVRYLRRLCKHMQQANFYNVYGQTEANSSMVFPILREKIPSGDTWKIPLGKALPNFQVYAMDKNGQKVTQPGVAGELLVRASTVAAGYWQKPDLTAAKFVIDPLDPNSNARVYRTGDLVTLDDDGNYCFGGRTDDMVKSRGYRIELGDIELALLSCPGVESAAAIAIPDEEVGNRIVAFATLTAEGSAQSSEGILSHCRGALPKYMVPESLWIRSDMPRTSTNKIDRKVLRDAVQENT